MKGKLKKEDWGWVVEFEVNEDECTTRSINVRPAEVWDLVFDEYWGSTSVHNSDIEFEIIKSSRGDDKVEQAKIIKR